MYPKKKKGKIALQHRPWKHSSTCNTCSSSSSSSLEKKEKKKKRKHKREENRVLVPSRCSAVRACTRIERIDRSSRYRARCPVQHCLRCSAVGVGRKPGQNTMGERAGHFAFKPIS